VALSKIAGVEKVSVDNNKKTASLTLKENTTISKEAVVKALEGTRYKVTSFEKL
jgi:copper chaperone CopZ